MTISSEFSAANRLGASKARDSDDGKYDRSYVSRSTDATESIEAERSALFFIYFFFCVNVRASDRIESARRVLFAES